MPDPIQIKRDLEKMASMNAPKEDIEAYLSAVGVQPQSPISNPITQDQQKFLLVPSGKGFRQIANPDYVSPAISQAAYERQMGSNRAKLDSRVLTMGENTKVAGADDVLGFVGELKDMYGKKGGVNWTAEATAEARRVPLVGGALYAAAGMGGQAGTDRQNFSDLVENLNNRLLYLRSGAQINDKEFQRLTRLMPSIYRKNELDVKQLNRFESEFQNIKSRIEKGVKWDGKSGRFVNSTGATYNEGSGSPQSDIDLNKLFSEDIEE